MQTEESMSGWLGITSLLDHQMSRNVCAQGELVGGCGKGGGVFTSGGASAGAVGVGRGEESRLSVESLQRRLGERPSSDLTRCKLTCSEVCTLGTCILVSGCW